jgi:metal transporter CNNM
VLPAGPSLSDMGAMAVPLGGRAGAEKAWSRLLVMLLVVLGCGVDSAGSLPTERPVVCVEMVSGHVRCGERVYAPVGGLEARQLQERTRPPKEGPEEEEGEHGQEEHGVEVKCEEEEQASGAEFWLYVGISAILVCSAGLFSGLTIGLMSLDLDELKMISAAPPNPHHPHNHEYANLIIPLVTDHHLLLVTLLLSNAAAMEALPIFLDKICPSPLVAILMSVTLVLFFGEVIPQALCTAYGLAIGAKTAPAVNVLIKLLYVIAKPIALLLDHIFGHEIKTLRRVDWIARLDLIAEAAQDSEMVEMHEAEAGEKPLTVDELNFMKGVLGLFDKRVSTIGNDKTPIMVSIKEVYSLTMSDRLTRDTLSDMLAAGFSRIPVLGDDDQQSVEGIILVKNLILVDPDSQQSVESLIVEERRRRVEQRKSATHEHQSRAWDTTNTAKVLIDESLLRVHKDISIFALIDLFQASKTQMALVYEYDVNDDNLRRSGRVASTVDTEMISEKMATAALRAAYESNYVLKPVQPALEADSAQGESETPRRRWITTGTTLIGLTTLEDIVEEMFGEQFVDETDP